MEWPRSEVGTLLCPCGNTGLFFVCVDTEIKDCQIYGVFGGYCSEKCCAKGSACGHPVPEHLNNRMITRQEAPRADEQQPALFG